MYRTGLAFSIAAVSNFCTATAPTQESHGVTPDIEVALDPNLLLQGTNSQLQGAKAYLGRKSGDVAERIRRVETGLFRRTGPNEIVWDKRLTIVDRMEHYHVPGVSIAVISDFQIEWTKGFGVQEAGAGKPVTARTLFQPASVGKTMTAVAALHFVEAGLLRLDENVNDRLTSWKVPENEFTTNEKVTLRRLLTHSAGVTVRGFEGFARGAELPTLRQILDGQPPANTPPIRVNSVPGTEVRYSGGGFMIVQQLLEDVAGQPFAEIMHNVVLEPASMTSTAYEAPLAVHRHRIAASAHDSAGRPARGKWHELACLGAGGGIWTTSSDLARFAIEIMLSHSGRSNKILSRESVSMMLTRQIAGNDYTGIGFGLAGEGRDLGCGHAGGNAPGFMSILWVYPEMGLGAVIMTNGQNGEALYREILVAIGIEYGWPDSRMTARVSVKDTQGMPVIGVKVVTASQPPGQAVLNGVTDEAGSLVFQDLRPGEYMFDVSHGTHSASMTTELIVPHFDADDNVVNTTRDVAIMLRR
jgi:CubicO group peptidase (beta-lactamase class C family)